jgi:hypothetical protein
VASRSHISTADESINVWEVIWVLSTQDRSVISHEKLDGTRGVDGERERGFVVVR